MSGAVLTPVPHTRTHTRCPPLLTRWPCALVLLIALLRLVVRLALVAPGSRSRIGGLVEVLDQAQTGDGLVLDFGQERLDEPACLQLVLLTGKGAERGEGQTCA